MPSPQLHLPLQQPSAYEPHSALWLLQPGLLPLPPPLLPLSLLA